MNTGLVVLLIILIGLLIVSISSVVDNNIIKQKCYEIRTDKIEKDCNIVFLSDLHGNRFGRSNRKLIEKIELINPDLVLIGGDMITAKANKIDSANWENAFSLIDGICKYKCFYGLGNHEYRMDLYREDYKDAFDSYVERLNKMNVDFLYNRCVVIEEYGIRIKGLAIDRKYYKRFSRQEPTIEYLEKCVEALDENTYEIMLAHNPEYFDNYAGVADLTLSGHVHGGIVRLPLLGGFISPRLTLFPKYDGGIFSKMDKYMIISRGLGSHTLPFRVFNPCELVVIQLKKA